jgi:hypothetical protein
MKRARVTRKGSHLGSLFAILAALLMLSFGTPAQAADDATARAQQASRQDEAPRSSNSLVGGKFLTGLSLGEPVGALLAAGLDARIDSPTHFIELGFGVLASSVPYYSLYSELGVSIYLLQRSTAPYIGVGTIGRFTGSSWWGGPQAVAYGQVGIALDRGQTTQYFADIRVAPSLTAIDISSDSDLDPKRIKPIEVGLQLGFGW